jgi:hypothetical protein
MTHVAPALERGGELESEGRRGGDSWGSTGERRQWAVMADLMALMPLMAGARLRGVKEGGAGV